MLSKQSWTSDADEEEYGSGQFYIFVNCLFLLQTRRTLKIFVTAANLRREREASNRDFHLRQPSTLPIPAPIDRRRQRGDTETHRAELFAVALPATIFAPPISAAYRTRYLPPMR
jgi:hypothetical protein